MGRLPLNHDLILTRYEELKKGKTLAQVANELNISTASLQKMLKEKGIHHPKYGNFPELVRIELNNNKVLELVKDRIPRKMKRVEIKHAPSPLEIMIAEEKKAADEIKKKLCKR